jgi:hypothetical protein
LVIKSRTAVTMAGIDQTLGVRMAEWLRPGLWLVLTIKLRGIKPAPILITKKPTVEGGAKSRPLVTVAGVSQILKAGEGGASRWPSGYGRSFGRYL